MGKSKSHWYLWLGAVTSILAFIVSMIVYLVGGARSTAIDFLPQTMRLGEQTHSQNNQQRQVIERYAALFQKDEVLEAKSETYDFLRHCASFVDDLPRNVICPGLVVVLLGSLHDRFARRMSGTRFMQIFTATLMVVFHFISAILALLLSLLLVQQELGTQVTNNPACLYISAVWLPISFLVALACSYSKDLLMKIASLLALTQSLSPLYVCILGVMSNVCNEVLVLRGLCYCLSDLPMIFIALANFYMIYARVRKYGCEANTEKLFRVLRGR
jgi:hypothetical protein